MAELAYLNGQITPVDEARISVRDRGFLFGDGVYDVVRVYAGKPYRLRRHVQRLSRSADAIGLTRRPDDEEHEAIANDLVDQAGLRDAVLYMQITRGAARRQAPFPDDVDATIFLSVEAATSKADALRSSGAAAIIVPDIRWACSDIKSINQLPKVLMNQRAQQQGAYEALYVDDDGFVWEGTSTNVFLVTAGMLRTPPEGSHILSGETRADVLEIARSQGIECLHEPLTIEQLGLADEVFLTGTLTEVLGVVSINGVPISTGQVGPMTRRIHHAYRQRVR